MLKLKILLITGICLFQGTPALGAGKEDCEKIPYDSKYPLTEPKKVGDKTTFRIMIISDKDKNSKVNEKKGVKWKARLMRGWLEVSGKGKNMKVLKIEWDEGEEILKYALNNNQRAMEMSELKVFNGKLYTCDDRTGIVYELVKGHTKPIPFVFLNNGDGHQDTGIKCEWMTVKDNLLYVGSVGMEWVKKDGSILHKNTFWVKTIDPRGLVKHYDWYKIYDDMRNSVGYKFPGYFYYEAVNWSEIKKKWFFLPRKGSKEAYKEPEDERRCTNKLFSTGADFAKFTNVEVGILNNTQGFSSFKFIPGSKDEVFIALKTVEVGNLVETYVGAYDVRGKNLLKLQKVLDDKYEGLEFI